jgi:hypothetical protein
MRPRLLVLVATAIAVLAVPAGAGAATADEFGIEQFSAKTVDLLSTTPTSEEVAEVNRAGSHPDLLMVQFKVNTYVGPSRALEPFANVKNVRVELPPGLVGNAEATPKCTLSLMYDRGCPRSSVVGFHELEYNAGRTVLMEPSTVYNLEPPEGVVARFGMVVVAQMVVIDMTVNSDGRYTIASNINSIPQSLRVIASRLYLFGTPAALNGSGPWKGFGAPGGGALTPMLTMGSQCGPQQPTKFAVDSWQEPGRWAEASYNPAAELTGCENLSFEPSLEMRPDSSAAGAPAAYTATLRVPQSNNSLATPPLKRAEITLPEGVTISPTAAQGLGSCTDEQAALDRLADPTCPENSRVGTVRIETPLLAGPLEGSIYQGAPKSMDAQSGEMFRIFLVASGYGVTIKQEGRIIPDPLTGRLRAVFDQAPQLPFSELTLGFRGGPRALLTNPARCGTYSVSGELTPWSAPQSGAPARVANTFKIDQNCGVSSQFTPGFEAGTANPVAGSFSPFSLRVTRPDGQQNLSSVDAVLPEGLLARLAGVPLCPDVQAATGYCPAASQVGTTVVGAGAGSNPIYVPQPGKPATGVYLAGPYRGAPYSLVVKVPAQAGPFDLGTVAVRNALYIDPETTQVTTKSDPLPQILQGVPVSYRDVRVQVDRPGFTINPTSCESTSVGSTIGSAAGALAHPSSRFQVGDCASLDFAPRLALSVKGKTRRAAHPAFKAVLTPPPGQANLRRAAVSLPPTEFLENAHIRTVCTRVQYDAGPGGGAECPKASIYGRAKAWTPLLDRPLEGPVFLRSSSHKLPDLVASLDGQIHIDLDGRIDSVHRRIRNTFEMVPDAPVSRFVLEMQGGKKGLLVNNTQLCRTTPRGTAVFTGQNGRRVTLHPVMKAQCKGQKKHTRHRRK